jgi:hypothetical protein
MALSDSLVPSISLMDKSIEKVNARQGKVGKDGEDKPGFPPVAGRL